MEDEPIDYEVKDIAWHMGLGPKDEDDEEEDYIRAALLALDHVQFGEAAECLDPIIDAMKSLDRLAGLDNVRQAKKRHWSEKLGPWPERRPSAITIRDDGDVRFICSYDGVPMVGFRRKDYPHPEERDAGLPITEAYLSLDHSLDGFGH